MTKLIGTNDAILYPFIASQFKIKFEDDTCTEICKSISSQIISTSSFDEYTASSHLYNEIQLEIEDDLSGSVRKDFELLKKINFEMQIHLMDTTDLAKTIINFKDCKIQRIINSGYSYVGHVTRGSSISFNNRYNNDNFDMNDDYTKFFVYFKSILPNLVIAPIDQEPNRTSKLLVTISYST